MKDNWKRTKISSFLSEADNKIEVLPNKEYTLLGLSLEGRGLFVREQKLGSEISGKYLNEVIPDQFIYSRLFAWKGAFDYTREEFRNSYVSNEFPAFNLDDSKADLKFIYYYFVQPKIWNEVEQYCIGVTKASRNRFKEKYFLDLEIPLPPLSEQKRIVAKIESIKSKIEAIQKLRAGQEKEMNNLMFSIYEEAEKFHRNVQLKNILISSKNWEKPIVGKKYRQMGIRVWGKGGYEREILDGEDTKYQKLMKVEENDLVINKIWVRNGALTIVNKELEGSYVSTEFPTFKYDLNILHPLWLSFLIKQKKFWDLCSEKSFGTSGKNRIKPEEFLRVEIPLPSMEEQNRKVGILEKANRIKEVHKEQAKGLAELLPSLLDKAFKGEL